MDDIQYEWIIIPIIWLALQLASGSMPAFYLTG